VRFASGGESPAENRPRAVPGLRPPARRGQAEPGADASRDSVIGMIRSKPLIRKTSWM